MLKTLIIIFLSLFIISCQQYQAVNQVVKVENKVDDSSSGSTGVKKNNKPIIQGLSTNPTNISPGSVMTFTVEVFDPNGDPVKYSWTATKGHLSATQGQLVHWTPKKDDGTLETGLSIITVQVNDNNGGVETSSINVLISADGSATTNTNSTTETTKPITVKPTPIPLLYCFS